MAVTTTDDQNITVILRIRPRNAREIKENSPVSASVASSSGGSKQEVQVKQSNDFVKTFTFDKVYGPTSTQEQVFQGISHLINEVFLGYNCTIFAYGQTGAGKTYTMEGDLSQPCQESGIIPRTLFSLFEQLEKDVNEYSVRVSYLELYNEELKDLLSPDNDTRKLKIFEDLNRKGSVLVQGSEEILVKNAEDVISILQRGSLKRQIAATKMNDTSSRSHGIFTVTVHIKETTSDGEELLKVGKLHLVDLAGSENIGRSGAVQGRAKEAGMINQSLLTLGRVINALVERSPHVPYRESKLTRILQDSLGGRTKTCIIANISPARDSLEESLSTLDYAHRAKNIRNKPEVNQKLTKRALIRDYATQIERLKSDLLATREKNGIFMSPESYKSIMSENLGNKTQLEEIGKVMEVKKEEFKQLQVSFNEKAELLGATSIKLEEAMEDLTKKQKDLEDLINETRELQIKLMEQEYLTRAHAETESNLNKIASGLVQSLAASATDIDGLHEKIARKTAVEIENKNLFEHFQSHLFQQFNDMAAQVTNYHQECAEVSHLIKEQEEKSLSEAQTIFDKGKELAVSGLDVVASCGKSMKVHLDSLQYEVSSLSAQITASKTDSNNEILQLLQKQQNVVALKLDSIEKLISSHSEKMNSKWATAFRVMNSLENEVHQFLSNTTSHHNTATQTLVEGLQQQIYSLKSENEALKATRQEDNHSISVAQDAFLQDMTSRFKQFVSTVSHTLDTNAKLTESQSELHAQKLQGLVESAHVSNESFNQSVSHQQDLVKKFNQDYDLVQNESVRILEEHAGSTTLAFEDLKTDMLKSHSSETLTVFGDALEKIDSINQYSVQNIKEWHQSCNDMLGQDLKNLKDSLVGLNGSVCEFDKVFVAHLEAEELLDGQLDFALEKHTKNLSDSLEACHENLQGSDLLRDIATGKTPRKKNISFPEKWDLTKPYPELLDEFHGKENPPKLEFNTPASKLPLSRQSSAFKRDTFQEIENI